MGTGGLKDGLSTNFAPVDPAAFVPPVLCFAAGTRIATPRGPVPVEALRPGMAVLTDGSCVLPVRRIWSGIVAGDGVHAPLRIAAGTFGDHGALSLSPNHRILVTHPAAELLFGAPSVLVMARSLEMVGLVRRAPCALARYHHIVLDRHAVVFAEGLPAESFAPAGRMSGALGPAAMAGADPRPPAPCLTHREGQVLAAALAGAAPRLAAAA